MRYALLLLPAVLAAALAGCGEEPPPPVRAPVGLTIAAPQDAGTTRVARVQVSGRVSPPGARVLVAGARVAVSGGRFATTVELREGGNVIDVGASAPGRRATWRAVRVTRRSRFELPGVVGLEVHAARRVLENAGLKVGVRVDEDLLDVFRDGPRTVCETLPEPGSQVTPGSTVEVVVSKRC